MRYRISAVMLYHGMHWCCVCTIGYIYFYYYPMRDPLCDTRPCPGRRLSLLCMKSGRVVTSIFRLHAPKLSHNCPSRDCLILCDSPVFVHPCGSVSLLRYRLDWQHRQRERPVSLVLCKRQEERQAVHLKVWGTGVRQPRLVGQTGLYLRGSIVWNRD